MNSSSNQKEIFLSGEGDSWFDRNKFLDIDDRINNDLILNEISRLEIKPKRILEVGCAEGWRLNELSKRYSCECVGFDPSSKAILIGRDLYPNVRLEVGTADIISEEDESVDLLIIGFCLYLCDRNDLFSIAREVDRVLENKGLIIILDFYSEIPYKNKYTHKDGIYAFKMDYASMFKWNPFYSVVSTVISSHGMEKIVGNKDERICISSLRKSIDDAYTVKPDY